MATTLVAVEDEVVAAVAVAFGGVTDVSDSTVIAAGASTALSPQAAMVAAGKDLNDMWAWWQMGAWVVVPTNMQVDRTGVAVMGAGAAKAAAERFPNLPAMYGAALRAQNPFMAYPEFRLLCAPTKDHWRQPSTLRMVTDAATRINAWLERRVDVPMLVVPALGCGCGGLDWDTVRLLLSDVLTSPRVHLCDPGQGGVR